jgi:hypothetical protein
MVLPAQRMKNPLVDGLASKPAAVSTRDFHIRSVRVLLSFLAAYRAVRYAKTLLAHSPTSEYSYGNQS